MTLRCFDAQRTQDDARDLHNMERLLAAERGTPGHSRMSIHARRSSDQHNQGRCFLEDEREGVRESPPDELPSGERELAP